MDIDILRKELLKAIRGRRTQGMVSRKLGYDYNQVYRWESGLVRMQWTDFLLFCKACRINLDMVIGRLPVKGKSLEDYPALVESLMGSYGISEVAKKIGCSRFTVRRWLNGISGPSLDNILMLVHVSQNILFEFVGSLVDVKLVPTLGEELRRRDLKKGFHRKHVYAAGVICALFLDDYKKFERHKEGFIAERTGISLEEERAVIRDLVDAGMIEFEDGRYVARSSFLDTTHDFEINNSVRKYYAHLCAEMLDSMKKPSKRGLFSYRIFAVSKAADEQIRKRHFEFYNDVATIIQNDNFDTADIIKILNVHYFDPSELSEIKKN